MRNLFLVCVSIPVLLCLHGCKSQATKGTVALGDTAAAETAIQPAQDIVEKYWKLIELNGKPIVVDSTFRKEPHIIFKAQDNRIIGSGGCNNLTGSYALGPNGRISIPQPIATRMACPNMEIENFFLQALQAADNYSVSEEMLVLNKGRMAPLARFKVVYMK